MNEPVEFDAQTLASFNENLKSLRHLLSDEKLSLSRHTTTSLFNSLMQIQDRIIIELRQKKPNFTQNDVVELSKIVFQNFEFPNTETAKNFLSMLKLIIDDFPIQPERTQELLKNLKRPPKSQTNDQTLLSKSINELTQKKCQALKLIPAAAFQDYPLSKATASLSLQDELAFLDVSAADTESIFILDPHLKTLLNDWEKVKNAYQQISKNNPATLFEFANQMHLLFIKLKEINPSPELNDSIHKQFAIYLKTTNNQLAYSEEKATVIHDLLVQSTIINERNKPALNAVFSTILDSINENTSFLKHDRERMAQSKIFSHVVEPLVGQLNIALQSFAPLAFDNILEQQKITKMPTLSTDPTQYQALTEYFSDDNSFAHKTLNDASDTIATEIRLLEARQKQTAPRRRKLPTAATEFKAVASQFPNTGRPELELSLEEQAAFKLQVSKVKYRVSDEELDLLNQITGINAARLIPGIKFGRSYSKDTLSFQEYMTQIDQKIAAINKMNQHWIRKWIPFTKLSTKTLEQAKRYLSYHHFRYTNAASPTELHDGIHKKSVRNKVVRDSFLDQVSIFSNSNIKKLAKILQQKTSTAATMKQSAGLLTPTSKGEKEVRNQRTLDALGEQGQLFKPHFLGSRVKLFEAKISSQKARDIIDSKKNLAHFMQRLNTDITAAKEISAKKFDNPVYAADQRSEFQQLTKLDMNALHQKIMELNNNITASINEQSSEEQIKKFVTDKTLIKELAEFLDKLIDEFALAKLPLSDFIYVSKTHFIDLYQELTETTKVPAGFNPKEDAALKTIGDMLATSKKKYTTLKDKGTLYLAALDLQILSMTRVLEIYKKANGSTEALSKAKDSLQDQTIFNFYKHNTDEAFLINAAQLQVMGDFDDLATGKVSIEDYEKRIKTLTESLIIEAGKVNAILKAAHQFIDTFTYLAGHTTSLVSGRQP